MILVLLRAPNTTLDFKHALTNTVGFPCALKMIIYYSQVYKALLDCMYFHYKTYLVQSVFAQESSRTLSSCRRDPRREPELRREHVGAVRLLRRRSPAVAPHAPRRGLRPAEGREADGIALLSTRSWVLF